MTIRHIAQSRKHGEHRASHSGAGSATRRVVRSMFCVCSHISNMSRKIPAVLACVALAGCDKPDDRICGGLAVQMDPTAVAAIDPQNVNACVERWAARLSYSPDDARIVAEAALGACEAAIGHYEVAMAKTEERQPDHDKALAYWRRQAMFRAVQWRAGKCGIERAK